jgi:hypothetical protein
MESVSTAAGMQIDDTAMQFANARSPIPESLEPDANVIRLSARHSQKHFSESVSTAAGM